MNTLQPNYDYTSYNSNDGGKGKKTELLLFPRIICVILAFAIWLYVMNVNSDDYEQTFTLIDVAVEGTDRLEENSNLSVYNLEESKVNVTIQGKRSDISQLTSDDFRAYIDVSALTSAARHSLDVSVDLPTGVALVSVSPSAINVSVAEIKEITVPVDVQLKTYSMDASFKIGTITSSITEITVYGPDTILDRILCARAEIDLGTQMIQTSVVRKSDLVLIDSKTGKAIDSKFLTMSADSVTVSIPISGISTVSTAVGFDAGFDQSLLQSVVISPANLTVSGDPKDIGALASLNVLTVNASTPPVVRIPVSSIILPDGVKFVSPPEYITVTITYRPEQTVAATEPVTEPPVSPVTGPSETTAGSETTLQQP